MVTQHNAIRQYFSLAFCCGHYPFIFLIIFPPVHINDVILVSCLIIQHRWEATGFLTEALSHSTFWRQHPSTPVPFNPRAPDPRTPWPQAARSTLQEPSTELKWVIGTHTLVAAPLCLSLRGDATGAERLQEPQSRLINLLHLPDPPKQ